MNSQLQSQPAQPLTLAQQNVQPWLTNFKTCWSNLVTPDVKTAIKANLPALRDYLKIIGEQAAHIALRSWLAIIIAEVSDFFNIGKNMSKAQIAMTAELIVENYSHFSLADFKACFRKAMASEKLFDRLDGNIICSWLNDYEVERNEALAKYYEEQDRRQYQPLAPEDGLTLEEYTELILARAMEGDKDAEEALGYIEKFKETLRKAGSSESNREKEINFRRRYLTEYLKQQPQ